MKNKYNMTTVLSALQYLIEKQNLSAAQVQVLLKETINNLEQ